MSLPTFTWNRRPCKRCDRGPKDKALAVRSDGWALCHRCGWRGAVDDPPEAPWERSDRVQRDRVHRLLDRTTRIVTGDPADLYLRGRGFEPPWPVDLRFSRRCPHPSAGNWPAMVAVVRDVGGRVVAVHRTYLTFNGDKAPVHPVRASLGRVKGNSVRLGPQRSIAAVTEGVEDGLAVLACEGGRVQPYCALSASGLASLELPRVHAAFEIYPDRDVVGARAARTLFRRLHDRERWPGFIRWPVLKDPAADFIAARSEHYER